MNSFDIAVLTVELDYMLRGSRISNIYQINPKTLLLKLRGHNASHIQLLIEAGKRIHTTTYIFDKPLKPSDFCMTLRKYLGNGIIDSIRQYEFERIAEITVKNRDESYRLIIELFGEGNIILLGSENKILCALTYRRMKDRNILRNEVFSYPPSKGEDPRKLSRERFREIKNFGQMEVVKALTKLMGVGGFYAEEILLRAGVEKDASCSSLKDADLDVIFNSLQEILTELTVENKKPSIFVDEKGDWIDVAPFRLKKYIDLKTISFGTFNEALDEYYAKATVSQKTLEVKSLAGKNIARLERVLQKQEETLLDLKQKAEVYREIGDAIYSRLNDLDSLLQRVVDEKRSGKSWAEIMELLLKEKNESCVPAVYFRSLRPESLSLEVSVEDQSFTLNIKESAQKNAAEYYMKAKKAKSKIKGVEAAINETREKIEKARIKMVEKIGEVSKPQLRQEKREWYEKFHWFYSSEGFLVVGGRDAVTNEVLIKKYMEPQDIVFHADIFGSPFVLIKTLGKSPSEKTIREAAQFTASYSRAWKEGLKSLDVYWVSPHQVSKTPPSGQYLPKGSFMIYGTKNYVKGVTLEIAVGLKKEGDQFKVIGGPFDAVAKQTNLYVKLFPDHEPKGKLVKQIRDKIAQAVSQDMRDKILKLSLDEIARFLP